MSIPPFGSPPPKWKAGTVANSITPSGGTGIKVGIGTAAPDQLLTLSGASASGTNTWIYNTSSSGLSSLATLNNSSTNFNQFITFGTAYAGNRFTTLTAAGLNEFSAVGRLVVGTYNSNNLYLGTNSIVRMTIDTSGNVGIGTTGPTELLHIKRDLNGGTTSVIENSSSGTAATAYLSVRNATGSSEHAYFGVTGTGFTTSGAFVQDAGFIGSSSALSGGLSIIAEVAPMRFYTGGTAAANERLRIDSAGNVGIGTTSPNNLLEVNKSVTGGVVAMIKNPTAGTGNYGQLQVNSDTVVGAFHSLSSTFSTSGYNYQSGSALYTNGSGGLSVVADHASGAMRFYTGGNADANERMRILSGGNVGIGTTTPDIFGLGATQYRTLTIQGVATSGVSGSGILELASQLPDADGADAGVIDFVSSNNTSGKRIGYIYGGTSGATANNRGGILAFATKANGGAIAERLRIDNVGNVGIGTTNPTQKLYIQDGGNPGAVLDSTSATGIPFVTLQNADRAWVIRVDGADSEKFQIRDATANAQRLTIDSTGNVGIGTTSPQGKLTVYNTAGRNITTSANGDTLKIKLNDNSDVNVLTLENTNDTANGTAALFNLGYGGDASTAGTAINGGKILVNEEQNWTSTASTQDSYMALFTTLDGTLGEKLRVTSGGNVGIGTAVPDYSLHVQKDQNALTAIKVRNATAGTAAQAAFLAYNDVSGVYGSLGINSSATTAYGASAANDTFLYAPRSIVVMADHATGIIKFATGGNVEKMRLDNSGKLGVGVTPTGNGLLQVKTSGTTIAKVGGTIFDHSANAGNVGTGEDDLYTDTLVASTLGADGDKVQAVYAGIFSGAALSTQELRVYFGGTKIYDSGALAIGVATNSWTVNVQVIRVSSSVVRCTVFVSTDFATLFPYSTYTEITGLTLSNTQVIKITGEAAGAGAVDNQIVAKLGTIAWQSSA